MLPTYKKIIDSTNTKISTIANYFTNSGIVSQFSQFVGYEGSKIIFKNDDSEDVILNLKLMSSEKTITKNEIKDHQELGQEFGTDFNNQITKKAFKDIAEVAPDCTDELKGKSPTEGLLIMLESMPLEFDILKRPIMPSIVVENSDKHKRYLKKLDEERKDPNLSKKFSKQQQNIIDKKYAEYIYKRNSRKLVD